MELFTEYEKPKEKTARQLCIDLWILAHPGWVFGDIQGRKMNSILKKIIQACKFNGLEGTKNQQVASFHKMLIWIMNDEYYRDEDLQVIDSHFNKIVSKIQQGKTNGKEKWSSKTTTQRIIDNL